MVFKRKWNFTVPCGFVEVERAAALTEQGWDGVVVEQGRGEGSRGVSVIH